MTFGKAETVHSLMNSFEGLPNLIISTCRVCDNRMGTESPYRGDWEHKNLINKNNNKHYRSLLLNVIILWNWGNLPFLLCLYNSNPSLPLPPWRYRKHFKVLKNTSELVLDSGLCVCGFDVFWFYLLWFDCFNLGCLWDYTVYFYTYALSPATHA